MIQGEILLSVMLPFVEKRYEIGMSVHYGTVFVNYF